MKQFTNTVFQSQEEMKKQFVEHLRKRNIPSAFSYWGKDETDEWIHLCQSREYAVYKNGLHVLHENLPPILQEHLPHKKRIDVVSLGIGNGIKDAFLLQEISKQSPCHYFPVDISISMMESGMKNIPNITDAHSFIADFHTFPDITDHIRTEYGSHQQLISILGNTLGNFGQIDILNILWKGMKPGDFLLLEITTRNERGNKIHAESLTRILESYNNQAYKDFVFASLKKAGFTQNEGIIEVEYGPNPFYPKLFSIETWFHLKKDMTAHYFGEEMVFKKDERILLYTSHKYTPENITELLDGNGFEVLSTFFGEESDMGLILSTKR
ncbi:MAG: L-histidine N(alpha)-methyltransferase [Candidatus Peregrinibacteria bacterium]